MTPQAASLDDRLFYFSREELILATQEVLNVIGYLLAMHPGLDLPPEHLRRITMAQLLLGRYCAVSAERIDGSPCDS